MAFNFFKKKKKDSVEENQHYYSLTVKEIVQETADAISVVFESPETGVGYKSGQFLTLIIPMDGKEVRRSYSFCTSPYTDDDLAVSVKRVEGGLMSNYLADNLKIGDQVKVMEPMGKFTTEYREDNKRHLVMFAGGSGITPFMSHIKSLLSQEKDSVASLIYCNRDIDSIIFKAQFEELQTEFEGRLHVIHILDNAPLNWQGPSGLLNREMLTKLFERIPDWGIDKTTYMMCGPEGMMKNVESLLSEQNIPADKIVKESFVSGTIGKESNIEESAAIGDHEVTILYSGEEHNVKVGSKTTILEAALDDGVDLPYSCQSGLCTACRCKLLSGNIKMDEEEGLSEAELNDGYVLICVGHPLTDDVKLEVG